MALEKTTELINSCDAAFKRSGLLRLAEPRAVSSRTSLEDSSIRGPGPSLGGTANVPGQSIGNAALDWQPQADAESLAAESVEPSKAEPAQSGARRVLGVHAVDSLLPDGGLPTGKVIELSLAGGAACGTQLALWACRAAQREAQLNATDSWCAFIDPTASLHAPGVLSNGVSLPRLLVLRPSLEDVERVALRLSEANVFSVIIIDLVGVPWAPTYQSPAYQSPAHQSSVNWSPAQRSSARQSATHRSAARSNEPQLEFKKRQNWNRTVRQLALRLEHTQAQVIVLTNADAHRSLPLPVALRLHLRADARGVHLHVVKESRGRVGAQGTVAWSEWGREMNALSGEQNREAPASALAFSHRAKTLPLPAYKQALVRTPDRNGRETEIPQTGMSRIARTSRASL